MKLWMEHFIGEQGTTGRKHLKGRHQSQKVENHCSEETEEIW